MKNINVFLRERLGAVSADDMHVVPNIPEKKLNNAIKSFEYEGSSDRVIAVFDTTVFGSAKEGILFTGEQFIYRPTLSKARKIPYSLVKNINYAEEVKGDKKDKLEKRIDVTLQDGDIVSLKYLGKCDYSELANVLEEAVSGFDNYQEENQTVAINDMDETLKVAYLKIIRMMVYDSGDQLDEQKAMAEILFLMTRLNLSHDSRWEILDFQEESKETEPLGDLLQIIEGTSPPGQGHSVQFSLVKDLINVYLSAGGTDIPSFSFLNENRGVFPVSDEEIQLALSAIETDRKLLKEDVSDDQVVEALKTLSAKAAAVGTPLAAVYLSGSVVGLSAAGMTSGLATLGMGGLLGFSSMATGIGMAVLLGVGVYAGVKRVTGVNELTRAKRRAMMLTDLIKQGQSTTSQLMSDINILVRRLNDAVEGNDIRETKIKKMTKMLRALSGAGNVVADRTNEAQGNVSRLACPRYLDLDRLRSLTREPTKAGIYDYIIGFYEERLSIKEDGDKQVEVVQIALKKEIPVDELDELKESFEAIGYFKVGDVLKGSALNAADKAKDKLTGMFS